MIKTLAVSDEGGHSKRRIENNKKGDPVLFRVAKYTAIGIEFPSVVAGGLFLGYLLDLYLGTSPWLAIVITLLAFLGAVIRLIQTVRHFSRDDS